MCATPIDIYDQSIFITSYVMCTTFIDKSATSINVS